MKIPVSDNEILALEKNKNSLLLRLGRIYILSNYKITEEEVDEKRLFRKNKKYIQKYITDAEVLVHHTTGDFIGVFDEQATIKFLIYNDMYDLKHNYNEFKRMLKAFGFRIQKIKEDDKPVATVKQENIQDLNQFETFKINLNKILTGYLLEEIKDLAEGNSAGTIVNDEGIVTIIDNIINDSKNLNITFLDNLIADNEHPEGVLVKSSNFISVLRPLLSNSDSIDFGQNKK